MIKIILIFLFCEVSIIGATLKFSPVKFIPFVIGNFKNNITLNELIEYNFLMLISEDGEDKINKYLLKYFKNKNIEDTINFNKKITVLVDKIDSDPSTILNTLYYNRFYKKDNPKPLEYKINYRTPKDIGLCENNRINFKLEIIFFLMENNENIFSYRYTGEVIVYCKREIKSRNIKVKFKDEGEDGSELEEIRPIAHFSGEDTTVAMGSMFDKLKYIGPREGYKYQKWNKNNKKKYIKYDFRENEVIFQSDITSYNEVFLNQTSISESEMIVPLEKIASQDIEEIAHKIIKETSEDEEIKQFLDSNIIFQFEKTDVLMNFIGAIRFRNEKPDSVRLDARISNLYVSRNKNKTEIRLIIVLMLYLFDNEGAYVLSHKFYSFTGKVTKAHETILYKSVNPKKRKISSFFKRSNNKNSKMIFNSLIKKLTSELSKFSNLLKNKKRIVK